MSLMTSTLEVYQLEKIGNFKEDDAVHYVCPCRGNDWSYCGLDMTGEPWKNDDDACPLCELAWEASEPYCPWGCDCNECGDGDYPHDNH